MFLTILIITSINGLLARSDNDKGYDINVTGEEELTANFQNILRVSFQKKRSLVFLYDPNLDSHSVIDLIREQPFYSVAVQPSLSGAMQFNGKYDVTGEFDDFITFEESKLYIYKVTDDDSFQHVVGTMKRLYFYRVRDRLLVILTKDNDHRKLRQVVWDLGMDNVIFLFTNGSVFVYDRIQDRRWFEIQDGCYFYNKAADFNMKSIRISMFEHVRDAIPSVLSNCYNGRDGLLARAFMKWINATGVYAPPTDGITYGENHGRKNITGVFGDVARNHTDIALNSRLMKPEFENVVEYSYPHDRDDLVILVPCGNSDSTIEYNKSFRSYVWSSILVFNGVCLLVFIKTDTFDTTSTAVLYTFGIFFGQSYSSSKTMIGRFLVLLYTFYAFLILVHYSSLLMSVITVPQKPKEIDTFEELADSKLKMYTVERYKRYLIQFGEESVKKLKERIYIVSEKQVMDLINGHGNYAIICKRSVADWAVLNRRNFRNGRMVHRIMKRSPFPAIVCYIVKYGSPLKLTLNAYLGGIVESGVQNHWMAMTLHQITCEESRFIHLKRNTLRKISLDELTPIFIIYAVGCVAAILFFVGELLSRLQKNTT